MDSKRQHTDESLEAVDERNVVRLESSRVLRATMTGGALRTSRRPKLVTRGLGGSFNEWPLHRVDAAFADAPPSQGEGVHEELVALLQSSLDAREELERELQRTRDRLHDLQNTRNQTASEALLVMHQAVAQRDEALQTAVQLREQVHALSSQLADAELRELRTLGVAQRAIHIALELAHARPDRARREALLAELEELRPR